MSAVFGITFQQRYARAEEVHPVFGPEVTHHSWMRITIETELDEGAQHLAHDLAMTLTNGDFAFLYPIKEIERQAGEYGLVELGWQVIVRTDGEVHLLHKAWVRHCSWEDLEALRSRPEWRAS